MIHQLHLTFSSSEAIHTNRSFAEADITVSGGSLSNFLGLRALHVYTAHLQRSSDGATLIDIGANTYTDAYGNLIARLPHNLTGHMIRLPPRLLP